MFHVFIVSNGLFISSSFHAVLVHECFVMLFLFVVVVAFFRLGKGIYVSDWIGLQKESDAMLLAQLIEFLIDLFQGGLIYMISGYFCLRFWTLRFLMVFTTKNLIK